MNTSILEIIEKKKHGKNLSKAEISFVVENYTKGIIPDYQMSALLMAIYFKGMNKTEIYDLTIAMQSSGRTFELASLGQTVVDKHSTGGVGDKVSLIVGPLVAALGIPMAKMSGRGLGFTGGTIDKLESIPGFQVNLNFANFLKQVKDIDLAIISQSEEIALADKLIYALRDVTGTIDSIPLISSSIMSKKLATGSHVILLDIKCGNGAFMSNIDEAKQLAQTMIEIGKKSNRVVIAEITSMDEPLGQSIGNKNEVLEAIRVLSNQGKSNIVQICVSSAAQLIFKAKKAKTLAEAKTKVSEVLRSGAALRKFKDFVRAQGGDVEQLFSNQFWVPKHELIIKAKATGFVEITSALTFAEVALELGAGRKIKGAKIDFEAGIEIFKLSGEAIKKGEPFVALYSSNPIPQELSKLITSAYKVTTEPSQKPIILAQIG